MPTTAQLLHLSKAIATKARTLIPRSSNRAIYGAAVNHDAQDSQWKNAPLYVQLQMMAQRSRSSKDEFRKLVDEVNFDIKMHSGQSEDIIDGAVKRAIVRKGYTVNQVMAALQSDKRSDKTHHKSKGVFSWFTTGDVVTPMEKQESNAKNAVRYRVGNCGENASLAFVMFAEYPGPNGDIQLPDLDPILLNRPLIERVAASNPGDHAFVVLNRAPGDIQNPNTWMTANVVICDPWWFHGGDALLANDRTGENADLIDYIQDHPTGLRVTGTIRLGQGHSDRYQQGKYHNLNYYSDSVDTIRNTLLI